MEEDGRARQALEDPVSSSAASPAAQPPSGCTNVHTHTHSSTTHTNQHSHAFILTHMLILMHKSENELGPLGNFFLDHSQI